MQISHVLLRSLGLICKGQRIPIGPQTQLLRKCTGDEGVIPSVAVPRDKNLSSAVMSEA